MTGTSVSRSSNHAVAIKAYRMRHDGPRTWALAFGRLQQTAPGESGPLRLHVTEAGVVRARGIPLHLPRHALRSTLKDAVDAATFGMQMGPCSSRR